MRSLKCFEKVCRRHAAALEPLEKHSNPQLRLGGEWRLTQNIKLNTNKRYFRQMVPQASFGSS